MKDEKNINKKGKSLTFIFGVVLLSFLFILTFISAEDFGYNYLEGDLDIAQAINYTEKNVNSSDYWDGLDSPANIKHNLLDNLEWSNAGHTIDTFINMNENSLMFADLVRANRILVWDETLNVDGLLSVWTHDFSNIFDLTVTDAGSTDFYSTEQYQFRSGDNLFQIIHDMYTGTNLNINVGNLFPEITGKDDVISFLDNNLTTTGNITADYFFGNWNGSSEFVPYTGATQNVDLGSYNLTIDDTLKLTNTTTTWNMYVDVNGTLVWEQE